MVIPSDDILWSAIATVEQKLIPAIESPLPRSLGFTLANMLRLVRVRMEREGQDLIDSIAEARALLARSGADAARLALSREYRAAGAYPGLASLGEELDALHRALDLILAETRGKAGPDAVLHNDILACLRAHHARVDAWMKAAFTGIRR